MVCSLCGNCDPDSGDETSSVAFQISILGEEEVFGGPNWPWGDAVVRLLIYTADTVDSAPKAIDLQKVVLEEEEVA